MVTAGVRWLPGGLISGQVDRCGRPSVRRRDAASPNTPSCSHLKPHTCPPYPLSFTPLPHTHLYPLPSTPFLPFSRHTAVLPFPLPLPYISFPFPDISRHILYTSQCCTPFLIPPSPLTHMYPVSSTPFSPFFPTHLSVLLPLPPALYIIPPARHPVLIVGTGGIGPHPPTREEKQTRYF